VIQATSFLSWSVMTAFPVYEPEGESPGMSSVMVLDHGPAGMGQEMVVKSPQRGSLVFSKVTMEYLTVRAMVPDWTAFVKVPATATVRLAPFLGGSGRMSTLLIWNSSLAVPQLDQMAPREGVNITARTKRTNSLFILYALFTCEHHTKCRNRITSFLLVECNNRIY